MTKIKSNSTTTNLRVWKLLKKNCTPFINEIANCKKNNFLLRGYNYKIDNIKRFQHSIEKRIPRNMPQNIHDEINTYFYDEFGWNIRNGIFCYGFDLTSLKPKDLGYGIFHLCFPIGRFEFVYSQNDFDLFATINNSRLNYKVIIPSLKFKNTNFKNALKLQPKFDNFSNEISIKANSYYLVNIDLANYLATNIWKSQH